MKKNIIAIGLLGSILSGCGSEKQEVRVSEVQPSLVAMDLSSPPSHTQLSASGQLGGVLSPTLPVEDKVDPDSFSLFDLLGDDDSDERMAFGQAIQNWNSHHYSDAAKAFDVFRKQFPSSAWASEATLHMACNARFTGQYSQANQLFQEVIAQNASSEYVGAQMMTAKAKSRLAVLRLMENNPDEAKRLFKEVKEDSPDWRLRTYASTWLRKLSLLDESAGSLLDCGTRALSYLLKQDNRFDAAEEVLGYAPSDDGFSIADMIALAEQYGYQALAVKATVEELAQITTPAILQIDREATGGKGHYWVLESYTSGQFNIFDSQMNRRFTFTADQLAKEWAGNVILLSDDGSEFIGRRLDQDEMENTYGGCCGIQRPPGEPGKPGKEPDNPKEPKDDCSTSKGAPVWSVNMINMNLYVEDTPLWYESAIGPNVNIKLVYNTQGVLAQNEPFGVKWMFNYATYLVVDPGKAVTIFSPDGREDVFVKDSAGVYQSDNYFRTTLTEKEGRYLLTFADGSQKVYGVPEGTKALQNFLLEQIDPFGQKLIFHYDNSARMTHIEDAMGRQTTLEYNAIGLIYTVRDPFGREAKFVYDDKRNLTSLTDMEGYTSTLTYDEDRFLTSITDAKGTTSFYIEPADGIRNGSNAYNPPGSPMWENYRITVTNPNGDKEEYYFDGFHNTGWYVNADNYREYTSESSNYSNSVAKTIYKYVTPNGRQGKFSQVTNPDGSYNKFTYYSNNKLKTITDERGLVEQYEWNSKGLVAKYKDKLGNETVYIYADNGVDLIEVRSPLGTILMTYNTNSQVTSYRDIEGRTTYFEYDESGNMIRSIDARGIETDFVRNASGLTKEIRVNSKTVSSYIYDEIGRAISQQGLNRYTTHYQYNKLDTLVKVTTPAGRSTEKQFGTCPRMLESETLPGGHTYDYEYDNAKWLTRVIDPLKGTITLERSKSGRVTAITDRNNNKTRFVYNPSGTLKEKVYADGSKLQYDYSKGRITQFTDARGIKKSYSYNNNGQLSSIRYSDSTASVDYEYDIFGRLSAVTDGTGKTTFGYYTNGFLKYKDGPLGNDKIELTYTELNELRTIAVDGKLNTLYSYDDLGRLTQVEAFGQQFSYSYDDDSTSSKITTQYPNDLIGLTQYDSKADLSEIVYRKGNEALASYQYRFDAAGQLSEQLGTSSWDSNIEGLTASYNALNQITSWNGDESKFAYDASGNLVKGLLPNNVPFTAEYDGESRLVKLDFNKNGMSYSERFIYGFDHMLKGYQRYENGKLVKDKQFVRLGLLELEQHNGSGQVEQQYAWRMDKLGGIGGLLMTKAEHGSYYYIYNHLGTVQKVINQLGEEVENYLYTPYGVSSGSQHEHQPFGYSTKRSDFVSGLVYFGYRFYVPNLRRWLNRDPLEEQDGMNLYSYVHGDPLGYIDPDGQWSVGYSLYVGMGGGVKFGYNPNTGKYFGQVDVGVGVGVGFNFDPNDEGDKKMQKCTGLDLSAGTEADWGVNLGPYGFGANSSTDFKYGEKGNPNDLFSPGPKFSPNSMDTGLGVGAHVSATGKFAY
ncbi:TPA: hypothetical protein NK433_004938 [Vibrio parahaemolyticus]|nr:hypothetical protein [Vibrio parahaemolyticus]